MTKKLVNNFKKGMSLASLTNIIYTTFYKNEKEANEMYSRIVLLVKGEVKNGGRNSPRAIDALKALASLAPDGAKGRNFRRYYVDRPDGWQKLPRDPKNIPYGFWY
ncbi:hypothetical protein DXX93_08635 [Thalassotalea euphylliae]|uniref:Uncharacterized protein n=1 Tax=Thalassotalea euphylliae TaxID=1655234 RepID=A0A3E0TQM2_9GAMM|nr:hypothetical protein [Thalassotalea euphylliae]REL26637.1 hypothetical protein DXX93_08635 [Thalassotalea euphylliae]